MRHDTTPLYTKEQMLAALQRVYAACGSCSQDDYSALRTSTEPSERTIRCRFGTFNKAKVQRDCPARSKRGVRLTTSCAACPLRQPVSTPAGDARNGTSGRGINRAIIFVTPAVSRSTKWPPTWRGWGRGKNGTTIQRI